MGGVAPRVGVICKTSAIGGVTNFAIRLAQGLKLAGAIPELVFLRAATREPFLRSMDLSVSYLHGRRSAALSKLVGLPVLKLVLKSTYGIDSSPDPVTWVFAPFIAGWHTRYDLVFFADESFSSFSIFGNAATRLTYSVVAHEGRPPTPKWLIRPQLRLYQRARVLYSTSPLSQRLIEARTGRKVKLLVMAVPSPSPGTKRERFFLLDTRWTRARNPFFLLQLLRQVPEVKFVVTGSFSPSSLGDTLKSEINAAGFDDRVTFVVNPSDAVLDSLYSKARAYLRWPAVTPTAVETGIGWGVIKAMENSCPVILDERMGFAEVLRRHSAGLPVPGGAIGFANAVETLDRDDQITSQLAGNAWRVANEYSIRSSIPDLRLSLDGLIGRRTR